MACSYPQWRIPYTYALLNNGKFKHRLADYYEKRVHNDGIIIQRPEFELIKGEYPDLASKIQQIPCGKCIQCRLAYSRQWANRICCELKTCTNAFFLTLTYDDAHLEFSPYVNAVTGEVSYRPCLVKKHLQDFIKRLRSWCSYRSDLKQRFFACGEFGDMAARPHYHVIIFDVPPAFLTNSHLFPTRADQNPVWTCDALTSLWPYGHAVYGDVTWESAAYVARYCVKKVKGENLRLQREAQSLMFPDDPWQQEFVLMSRRPGIGRAYYEIFKDEIYQLDEVTLTINGSPFAVKPAMYFDKLFDIDHHLQLRKIKTERSNAAQHAMEVILTQTDLSEEEYLKMKAESKEESAKRLVRPEF